MSQKRVVRTFDNVSPARPELLYEDDPRFAAPRGNVFPAIDQRGRIVRLDISTGAVTPLLE